MRENFLPLLILGAAAAACSNPPPVAAPAAFDRPESVSFFCWDRNSGMTVPLSECAPAEDDEDGLPELAGREMHAVVTQTTTGEVAAVQVTGDDDHPAGPIDSDVRVPGFTFAAVGEVPSDVLTPPSSPEITYVISQGSGTLHTIETGTFRDGLGARVTPIDDPTTPGMPFFPPGSRPVNMELAPDEDALLVTVPNILAPDGTPLPGELWIIPIDGATVGAPVKVPLATDVPVPVDLTVVPEEEQPPVYELVCGFETTEAAPIAPRAPLVTATLPAPWGIAIDVEQRRAIVSDTALPVLHVIDLATQTEVETINVGAPTTDIELTPRVPATIADTAATERFLYAIDGDDDSVLAVDYSDPARASYGAVLTVSAAGARDRLRVPVEAQAIEVVMPAYDPDAVSLCTNASETDPSSLHGVFLAVATRDGLVRIFDVFDLDVPCRGAGTSCPPVGTDVSGADAQDERVAIGRHRPRLAEFVEADEGVAVTEGPTWDVGATQSTVGDDGSAGSGLPALQTLTCEAPLGPVFPETGDARICAVTDPWIAQSDRYTFAWEGAIPFTATTGGNFVEGEDVIEVRFDPCALGVLGSSDVPTSGELGNYGGDVVAITGPLPPSLSDEERAECGILVQETETGETSPVLLPLVSASSDPDDARDTYLGRLRVGSPEGSSLAEVRRCFPELLQLEVRVGNAFVARSQSSGFRHGIVRGADGTCEVDPAALAAGERGRAFLDETFVTPGVAIRFERVVPAGDRPVLQFVVSDVPLRLVYAISFDTTAEVDLPSLITELEFNEFDDRLYVVDQARRGLVRLDLLDAAAPFEAIFR